VLCGARVRHDGDDIHITREPGDMRRVGTTLLETGPGETMWDGRFSIATHAPGIVTTPVMAGLTKPDREKLRRLPADLRPVLPVLHTEQGAVLPTCDALGPYNGVTAACWVPYRFLAAAGRLMDEQTIHAMARDLQQPARRTEM